MDQLNVKTIFLFGSVLLMASIALLQFASADPPYVRYDAPTEIQFWEGEGYWVLNLNDVFVDDDPEDVELNFSSHEVENLNVSIFQSTGQTKIMGQKDYHGVENLTFQATDANGSSVNHTITIIILPINDPPEIIRYIEVLNRREAEDFSIDLTHHFRDIDGDDLYYIVEDIGNEAFTHEDIGSDPREPLITITCLDPDYFGLFYITLRVHDRDPSVHDEDALWVEMELMVVVESQYHPPFVGGFEPNTTSVQIEEMEVAVFEITEIGHPWSAPLTYVWSVNGEDVPESNLSRFQFPPEASYHSAGVYTITVEMTYSFYNDCEQVYDAPEWTLTVHDVNRGPSVSLVTESSKVEEGEDLTLHAAYSDPDGDTVSVTWYHSRDRVLWTETGTCSTVVLRMDLPPGDYYFKCIADDGKETEETGWIKVSVEPMESPGPSTMAAVVALAIATIPLVHWSGGRPFHNKAY